MFEKLTTQTNKSQCNMIIYGAPGVGKTVFAESHPGKVYLIDFERGSNMYADQFDHVLAVEGGDWRNLDKIVKFLKEEQRDASQSCAVVVDSITAFWDAMQYTRAEHEKNGVKQVSNLNLGDWGVIKKIIKNLVTKLQDLNMTVIVIAHEKAERNSDGFITDYIPDVEKNVPYVFDYALRMIKTTDDKRFLRVTKRRGELLPKDEYEVTGATFHDIFGEGLSLNMNEADILRNYRIRVMLARNKKQLQTILDEAKTKLPDKDLAVLKETVKEKVRRLA